MRSTGFEPGPIRYIFTAYVSRTKFFIKFGPEYQFFDIRLLRMIFGMLNFELYRFMENWGRNLPAIGCHNCLKRNNFGCFKLEYSLPISQPQKCNFFPFLSKNSASANFSVLILCRVFRKSSENRMVTCLG